MSAKEYLALSLIKSNPCNNEGAGWFCDPDKKLILPDWFPQDEEIKVSDNSSIVSTNGKRKRKMIKSENKNKKKEGKCIVIEKFNYSITREKLSCLQSRTWLNDEVINFYTNILDEYDEFRHGRNKKFCYFSTFFYGSLTESGSLNFADADKHTRKVDLFRRSKLFIPINIGNYHWVLVVVSWPERHITFYDSQYEVGNGLLFCGNILKWIEHYVHEKKSTFNAGDWSIFEGAKGIPQQDNGSDCGVFVLMYMDFISRDVSVLNLHCSEMETWRKKIALTIIRGSLVETLMKRENDENECAEAMLQIKKR